MTPQFAQAVDRIFLAVLGLLDRIGRNETLVPSEERVRIRAALDHAESVLGQSPDWQLSRYALVTWIDDVLIEAPWEGRQWWEENALEVEIFNTRDAFTAFYTKAVEAATLTHKNALEVFYVCVVLGFRGLYRDPVEAVAEAESMGMPGDLETWARQTSTAIKLGQGLPPIAEKGMVPNGAPALESKAFFISYLLIGVILAGLNLIVFLAFVLPKPPP
jgi:type VI secretion system protein ImpK